MAAQLLLRCGDVVPFCDGKEPVCPTHGKQGVARVLGMPAPRFRGPIVGPHAQTVDLEPLTMPLVSKDDRG